MKSIKYITLCSLLFVFGNLCASACGPYYPYQPSNLRVFRSCSPALERQWNEGCRFQDYENYENCLLWQRVTSKSIPLKDIEEVIYKANSKDLKNLQEGTLAGNAFAHWLADERHNEDLTYVRTAKEIEEIRNYMNDPWYYSYDGDEEHRQLDVLLEICGSYRGQRHVSRYGLQTLRLLFSRKYYQSCIDLWEKTLSRQPHDIVTDMAASYAAGAYYRTGDRDKAIELYEQSQDIGSLIALNAWDSDGFKSEFSDPRVKELDYIMSRFPNTPLLSIKLQEYVRDRETYVNKLREWEEGGRIGPKPYMFIERIGNSWVEEDGNEFYAELKKFARKVIKSRECSQKSLWLYTLAFLEYLDGNIGEAKMFQATASRNESSPLLQQSIKAFGILLNAVDATNSPTYLRRLHEDLIWIDARLAEEPGVNYEDTWQYANKNNRSVSYWQNVIRRILLGEVCPRMIKSGNKVLALQLANYASNRIGGLSPLFKSNYFEVESDDEWNYYPYHTKVISLEEYRNSTVLLNNFDYSNQFFNMTDSVDADIAAEYARRILKPESSLDKFLNERSYTDSDYINDLVGTLYLREMNYVKAVEWLSKVSVNYQARTNLSKEGYFSLDPFAFQTDYKRFISNSADYKLRFAQEMSRLENLMASECEVNRRANAKIRYATGLRNSFGPCWYLTQYGYGEWFGNEYTPSSREGFEGNRFAQKAYETVDKLMEEALAEFTDPEEAAQALLEMREHKTLMCRYPSSRAAAYFREHCDSYRDYALQKL